MGILKRGIDVSYAQGKIDWGAVAASGVEFAIIRAGYGRFDYGVDSRLEDNIKGCKDSGIPFGFYHYSYAQSAEQAAEEASAFLDRIKGHTPEYPVWLDFEERVQTLLPMEKQLDIIDGFLAPMEAAGYYAGLYSYRAQLEGLLAADPERLARYDVWSAQWAAKDGYSGAHGMWQYSSSGTVAGINGPVDMNGAYLDYPAIIKAAGKNGFPVPEEAGTPSQPEAPAEAPAETSPDAGESLSLSAQRDRLADKLRRIGEIISEL